MCWFYTWCACWSVRKEKGPDRYTAQIYWPTTLMPFHSIPIPIPISFVCFICFLLARFPLILNAFVIDVLIADAFFTFLFPFLLLFVWCVCFFLSFFFPFLRTFQLIRLFVCLFVRTFSTWSKCEKCQLWHNKLQKKNTQYLRCTSLSHIHHTSRTTSLFEQNYQHLIVRCDYKWIQN